MSESPFHPPPPPGPAGSHGAQDQEEERTRSAGFLEGSPKLLTCVLSTTVVGGLECWLSRKSLMEPVNQRGVHYELG